jgi:hypothetical protein
MIPTPISSPLAPLSSWWHPAPGLTWQWHLSEPPVDTSVEAQVYDIDLFDNSVAVIEELHTRGRKVIGYLSAGSCEDFKAAGNWGRQHNISFILKNRILTAFRVICP